MADDFGNRMKNYESFETERKFIPLLPVYARLDGRSFSKFTKDMRRPYDERMSNAMIATTKYLVKETHSKIGYTTSDEISLVWKAPDYKSNIFFDGKVHKMTSVLASMATAAFTQELLDPVNDLKSYIERMPHFDCRVCSFPNEMEATNMVLWRSADAVKNAVSMAARAVYSHKELQNKNGSEMQEMMFLKGINFNNYPRFFKQGTFVRRVGEMRKLTGEEIAKIMDKFGYDEERLFERFTIEEIDMPIFSKVANRVEVVFNNAEPVCLT